jgi:transcriptional regulator with XRE-family HTH domain
MMHHVYHGGMELGQFVREARRRAGLSQRELAARVGISQPQVARIERGSVDTSFRLVRRLVRASGFDVSIELVDLDDSAWSVAQTQQRMSIDARVRANRALLSVAGAAKDHA